MLTPDRTTLADRPVLAFVAILVVAATASAALQFAVGGEVDPVPAVIFAVVFAGTMVGLASVRARRRN